MFDSKNVHASPFSHNIFCRSPSTSEIGAKRVRCLPRYINQGMENTSTDVNTNNNEICQRNGTRTPNISGVSAIEGYDADASGGISTAAQVITGSKCTKCHGWKTLERNDRNASNILVEWLTVDWRAMGHGRKIDPVIFALIIPEIDRLEGRNFEIGSGGARILNVPAQHARIKKLLKWNYEQRIQCTQYVCLCMAYEINIRPTFFFFISLFEQVIFSSVLLSAP